MTPLIVLTLLVFANIIGAQNSTNVTVTNVQQAFTTAQIVPDGEWSSPTIL